MTLPSPEAVRSAAVRQLEEDASHAAGRIVARARAARRFGATADAYRRSAKGLDRQADKREALLPDRPVGAFRAAAAENRLVADALDAMEGRAGP